MKIKVGIKGRTALLMHRFNEAAQAQVASGVTGAFRRKRMTPRERAESFVYQDKRGYPYLPGLNILAGLREAGAYHKIGRSKITTQRSSLVPAALTIEEEVCFITPRKWEVDSRPVVIPSTGGRIMEHRPRFDEWTISYTLDVDETIFDEEIAHVLVEDGGRRSGLGDLRPNRNGPYGKYFITMWEVLK